MEGLAKPAGGIGLKMVPSCGVDLDGPADMPELEFMGIPVIHAGNCWPWKW